MERPGYSHETHIRGRVHGVACQGDRQAQLACVLHSKGFMEPFPVARSYGKQEF